MSSKDESFDYFQSFSFEDMLAKARGLHEDLGSASGGWRKVKEDQISSGQKVIFWIKSFPDEEIPVKVLFKCDLPLSAEHFVEVLDPKNMEYRKKWDKGRASVDVLEEYPENRGHIITSTTKLPWPISNREFVLYQPPSKEVEWYGKQAFLVCFVNAVHPSKPAGVGGVRATNAGQFFIAIPDDEHPESACGVFGLAHNAFNGWIPSTIESLYARNVPKAFITLFDGIVEGHKMIFGNN